MLSEIAHSSKRMGKSKKGKGKLKDSGFDFLLQSLERDKENQAPNQLTAYQNLTHSIQIDPLLTAPVHSFTLQCPQSAKPPFYLDNVKLLDRSDISLSDNNHSGHSRKGREASSKSQNGRKQKKIGQGSGKSRRSDNEQLEELVYKMKQYLSITDDILSEIDISRWKFGKKARMISKELVSLITSLEAGKKNTMNHSVKTTSFNMYGSEILPSKPAPSSSPFVKRINGLQVEREKLNSLISQHQMANIKMYIKLNEGESEEIEQCKKQLALLFDKYKQLEALVGKDKKKMVEMIREKEETVKKCSQLTAQNHELLSMIQQMQESLETQQKTQKNKQNYLAPIRVSMLRPQSNIREQSYPSVLSNSEAERGELHLQSLQNSYNEDLSDQIAPLNSSIATSTSRPNKKGGRLGINLNSLLDNLTQQQVRRIAQDPEQLKTIMKECRQTIVKMEDIITEQNKELELSLQTLEDLQIKIKCKDEVISRLQQKLALLKQTEREQNKKKKQNKCTLNDSDTKVKKVKKQDRKLEVDQKGKVCIDLNFKKTKYDQYRIIAMQALALEQAIGFPKIR